MDSLMPAPKHNYCNGICEGCKLYPECPDEDEVDLNKSSMWQTEDPNSRGGEYGWLRKPKHTKGID